MLTILNLINYYTGDNISIYILIISTIYIYYYLISNYFADIILSKTYLIILLFLMLIDICSIIIIFYYDNFGFENLNNNFILKNECDKSEEKKLLKDKKNKSKKIKKNKNNKDINEIENVIKNTNLTEQKISEKDSKKNYNSIKIFGEDNDISINSYK